MARTPRETIDQADEAFNRGDLEALLSHYEENAVWVVTPGHVATGTSALRTQFAKMLRNAPRVIKEYDCILECGDIALCTIRWRMVDTVPGSAPGEAGGVASTVLRRQVDGHWRVAIDNPWGAAILSSEE